MDFVESLCKAIADGIRDVWGSLSAFVRLDTTAFMKASEAGSRTDRVKLTARLAALTCISLFAGVWLLDGGATHSLPVLARLVFLSLVSSMVIASPIYIVLRLYYKRPSFHFFINLISTQQTFAVISGVLSAIVLVSAEPARTDFSLLRDGIGQRTAAYGAICGDLESAAEITRLSWNTSQRSTVVARDTKEILDNIESGPPRSMADFERHVTIMEAQISRREAELLAAQNEMTRLFEIDRERTAAAERFRTSYPTVRLAKWTLILGLAGIGLLSSLHVWKAVVWPAPRWRKKLTAVGLLLTAWMMGGVLASLWVISSNAFGLNEPTIPTPPEVALAGELRQDLTGIREYAAALDLAASRQNAQLEISTNQLRRQFHTFQRVCPTLNNHGLW